MTGDLPLTINALHVGVVGRPQRQRRGRLVDQIVQSLHVGAAMCGVTVDGGKLRAEHVLRRSVGLQRLDDISDPGVPAVIGVGPKAKHFDVIGEHRRIERHVPLIDALGVFQHYVHQV